MFEIEGISILKHLGGIWNMLVQSVVPNRTLSNNKGMYYNCVFQNVPARHMRLLNMVSSAVEELKF